MRNHLQYRRKDAAKRCAICDGKFGLIRHYSWRTALCSKMCVDRFKSREEATADGCYAFTPPDKQLRSESRDFEARRLRNERSMQTSLVEPSHRLLAKRATKAGLGGAT